MNLAVFFLSAAILAFELVCTQLFGFVIRPYAALLAIGIAMLGAAIPGALLMGFGRNDTGKYPGKKTFTLTLVTSAAILLTFATACFLKSRLNARTFDNTVNFYELSNYYALGLALAMTIPYVLFGWIMALVFRCTDERQFGVVYAVDLAGAALGGASAYLAMEYLSFSISSALPVGLSLLGAFFFFTTTKPPRWSLPPVAVISLFLLLWLPWLTGQLEPAPELYSLNRLEANEGKATEIWRRWTSYTRVGISVQLKFDGQTVHKITLGNGEGHAFLHPYPIGDIYLRDIRPPLFGALGPPNRSLVLMAGAGSDMILLDKLTGGVGQIKGVELNHRVREAALAFPAFGLEQFFKKKNIDYVIDEARSNLERDNTQYDLIVYSWAGAPLAYYTGGASHSAQYLFTKEGIGATLKHLTPQGLLIVFNTSKLRLLATLKTHFPHLDAAKAVVIVGQPNAPDASPLRSWDSNILLLKPQGFSKDEVSKIRNAAEKSSREIIYAPGEGSYVFKPALKKTQTRIDPFKEAKKLIFRLKNLTQDSLPEDLIAIKNGLRDMGKALLSKPGKPQTLSNFRIYQNLLETKDVNKELNSIQRQSPLRIVAGTDDNPFILNEIKYSKDSFFSTLFERFLGNPSDIYTFKIRMCFFVSLLAIGLILLPIFLKSDARWNRSAWEHAGYFSLLGAGFMCVEMGLINRLRLLVGNPGLALTITLCGLIAFSGLGSLLSSRLFKAGFTFFGVASSLVALLVTFLAWGPELVHAALPWSDEMRILLAIAILAPFGFLMGQLFPQGLKLCAEDDPKLIPWAWAVNGASGTIAAVASWMVTEYFGFSAIVAVGATCYSGILLIPRFQTHRSKGRFFAGLLRKRQDISG